MEIRPIREEEKERFVHIITESFVMSRDVYDQFMQTLDVKDTRAIFDDKRGLVAGLSIVWEDFWLGERTVKMVGMTVVATPPENRRQGYLRQLLQAVLEEAHSNGYNLSSLYPFNYGFYRKFGYEIAGDLARLKLDFEVLASYKKSQRGGEWQEYKLADWPKFKEIYDQYAHGKIGLMERRDEDWWTNRTLTTTYGGVRQSYRLYIWHDEAGKARAYVAYDFKVVGQFWERELQVADMAWTDEAAREEIFGFLANHDSQAQTITMKASVDDQLFARVTDPYRIAVQQESAFMLRILDVTGALTERAWPHDETVNFSLAINDDRLPWNDNRTYEVSIKDGKASVEIVEGKASAGLECDVRVLAQLYDGYLSPKKAARFGKIIVRRQADLEAAQRAFSPSDQPAPFMADHW